MTKLAVHISNQMGALASMTKIFETMEEAEQYAAQMESQGFTAKIKAIG